MKLVASPAANWDWTSRRSSLLSEGLGMLQVALRFSHSVGLTLATNSNEPSSASSLPSFVRFSSLTPIVFSKAWVTILTVSAILPASLLAAAFSP
ncbi:hypothetical protein PCANC_04799 [Puccinia coronata f. sp. avenae]|uniref:Uncharacterized protein n=1 Tax=Puccinia coronata f. sp. avenae TaxID=200324 RepID=A0A2N5VWQ3_9BASI|nr:hypothetical protein PCANC_23444 [Puccinia coronata f. sp. avenae]PLW54396.1 hypothetical protein PCANC_04799 [Puccinia coronata f. sp. avenae]